MGPLNGSYPLRVVVCKAQFLGIFQGSLSRPSITKTIMMGLWVEPRITYTSQSNRGTRGHHPPYRRLCRHNLGTQDYRVLTDKLFFIEASSISISAFLYLKYFSPNHSQFIGIFDFNYSIIFVRY